MILDFQPLFFLPASMLQTVLLGDLMVLGSKVIILKSLSRPGYYRYKQNSLPGTQHDLITPTETGS